MANPNDPEFPFNRDDWQRFERMARRGWRNMRQASRMGDLAGLGENFRIGRMLASGDLRLVSLYLIEQQPRHGYDLIKAFEDKTAGFYVPSPGIVYPALTFLEEAGYVTSAQDGNKKLYTITDDGRAHLAENRAAVQSTLDYLGRMGKGWKDMRERMSEAGEGMFRGAGPQGGMHDHHGPHDHEPRGPRHRGGPDRDIPGVAPEVNQARRALKAAIAQALSRGEDEQARVAEILNRAARDIAAGGEPDIDLG